MKRDRSVPYLFFLCPGCSFCIQKAMLFIEKKNLNEKSRKMYALPHVWLWFIIIIIIIIIFWLFFWWWWWRLIFYCSKVYSFCIRKFYWIVVTQTEIKDLWEKERKWFWFKIEFHIIWFFLLDILLFVVFFLLIHSNTTTTTTTITLISIYILHDGQRGSWSGCKKKKNYRLSLFTGTFNPWSGKKKMIHFSNIKSYGMWWTKKKINVDI